MRADGVVTGLVCHFDGFQGLGDRADLVQFDQDSVARTQLDALCQTLGVGHKQVVTHQLYLAAQLAGHLLPALPVLFVQTVLDGDDGVLFHKALPVRDQLGRGELGARLGQLVKALALGALPLGSGGVHCQHKVPARQIARLFDGSQNGLDGLLIAGKVGCKAALIAHGGSQTLGLQDGSQRMEHLGAPAQRFLKRGCAHRHDHKLLCIHSIRCVCAAVQNVHHGHRQAVGIYAAQKTVQRHFQRSGCCAAGCNGHRQNGVCAQIGFILGAVYLEHGSIHGVNVGSIHAHHCVRNDRVDVFHRLGHALAQIAALVAVPQFQRLKLAGGCTGRGAAARHGAVRQRDLGFYGGVAAGVQNLAANNSFNFQIIHLETLLNIIFSPILPGRADGELLYLDSYT